MRRLAPLALLALPACGGHRPAASPRDEFWGRLAALCGKAFEGKRLVMHARERAPDAIRVPFHVGEDRSRTWVFTRPHGGLRFKHDPDRAASSASTSTSPSSSKPRLRPGAALTSTDWFRNQS